MQCDLPPWPRMVQSEASNIGRNSSMGSSVQKEAAASAALQAVPICRRQRLLDGAKGTCASPVTHNAGERLVEKRMQCSLDLVRVVLMYTVEQTTVDKSANVVGADLDRHIKKAAVAAIAMPSLTDGGSRFSHNHSLLGP
jgi:hypothetical protein